MTLNLNPDFLHICPGDGCAVCWWVGLKKAKVSYESGGKRWDNSGACLVRSTPPTPLTISPAIEEHG